jgi:tetratricopeptide (TPR) repeat protein
LPSVFLFLLVAIVVKRLFDSYKTSLVSYLLAISVGFLIFGLGMGTYIRNMAWATERMLWEDAIEKTGNLARPYQNLATQYYVKKGRYDEAKSLLERSTNLEYAKTQYKAKLFHKLAAVSYKLGDYQEAFEYEKTALKIYPGVESHYTMVLSLIKMNRLDEALAEIASSFTSSIIHRRNYLNLAGKILIHQGRYHEALSYFNQAINFELNHFESLLNTGMALSKAGRFELGDRFLKIAQRIDSNDMILLMAFIENRARSNDEQIDWYLNRLLFSRNVFSIIQKVKELSENPVLMPLSEDILMPILSEKLDSMSQEMAGPRAR